MTTPGTRRPFFYPLPFWHVLLVFLVAQLIPTFVEVALREGLGVRLPHWVAGGVGGLLGVVVVYRLAKRRLAQQPHQSG